MFTSILNRLCRQKARAKNEGVIAEPSLGPEFSRGTRFAKTYPRPQEELHAVANWMTQNSLESYVKAHHSGRGIWKWQHYFEVYERHFHKFIGKPVNVLEIGVYSGGSLDMWRHYFGPQCRIFGVDIAPECKAYESNGIKIFVGDQADRQFWSQFKRSAPRIDVLIDDGGHQPEQQIITLEEMLPHLALGGIYVCEDIHIDTNPFAAYIAALCMNLNAWNIRRETDLSVSPSPFQSTIHSIHSYPFVTVIEKRDKIIDLFTAPRRGTEWQPFYDDRHSLLKKGL